ncbi:MAG: DUF2155 domain-containing protein [Acidobacteria bacterium]|nr:DUF2155 domain-containing protein [Acidobacteriota bacterium]
MKRTLIPFMALALAVAGCSGKKAAEPGPGAATTETAKTAAESQVASHEMPKDQMHSQAMAMNREIHLDDSVRAAWSGIRVKVEDAKSDSSQSYDIPIGATQALGDTGLTLQVKAFVPDFTMGSDGITTRSAQPNNPGAEVVITEKGKPDFDGWLFSKMPDIHPFSHERYRVTLVAGIPTAK